ncbi:MAG: hypothetical protein QNJ38_02015 [Prochloraceae cyanobacterium]|nr:hypothetical protein [Prochloraceae cyanobacterium]
MYATLRFQHLHIAVSGIFAVSFLTPLEAIVVATTFLLALV